MLCNTIYIAQLILLSVLGRATALKSSAAEIIHNSRRLGMRWRYELWLNAPLGWWCHHVTAHMLCVQTREYFAFGLSKFAVIRSQLITLSLVHICVSCLKSDQELVALVLELQLVLLFFPTGCAPQKI